MARRTIFHAEFWRGFAVDLRRAGRDKKARGRALSSLFSVLYFICVVWFYGYQAYKFHDRATAIAIGTVLFAILTIRFVVLWSQRHEANRQLAADIAEAPPELVRRLQELAHCLAVAPVRAASELWATKHSLPQGFSVETRRVLIDGLRSRGLWDRLPSEFRQWMMAPDGSWPQQLSAQVLSDVELLHSLLWCLALIPKLRPLDSLMGPLPFKTHIKAAVEKTAPGIRPIWDVRLEHKRAREYFTRCYAESIFRGDREPASEDQRAACERWVRDIADGDIPDMLAGNQMLAEVDQSTLASVARATACRLQMLTYVMSLLDGGDVWDEMNATVYGPFRTELAVR